MAQQTITEDEKGKKVIDSRGETIGVVTGVREGRAYVDPDPGMGEKLLSKLGWEDIDEDDYPLDPTKIDVITDDEVRLKRNL
jgi:hypothetical protein